MKEYDRVTIETNNYYNWLDETDDADEYFEEDEETYRDRKNVEKN